MAEYGYIIVRLQESHLILKDKIITYEDLLKDYCKIYLDNCDASSIKYIPKHITHFKIINSDVGFYHNLSSNLTHLTITNQNITYVNNIKLPNKLVRLEITHTSIKSFNIKLPETITWLNISNNRLLNKFHYVLPKTMIVLFLQNNNLKKLKTNFIPKSYCEIQEYRNGDRRDFKNYKTCNKKFFYRYSRNG